MVKIPIDLSSINREEFLVTDVVIGGETCNFVRPLPTFFDWRQDVLHYRSSIWNSKGEPVSLSFKKFFNLEEKPAIDPFPAEFANISLMEKLDGSTLIVSRYNGETILRTRGSVNAFAMPNGPELIEFRRKYPVFFDYVEQSSTRQLSFIFEWVSPLNRIILKYDEPDIVLTTLIDHRNYEMMDQIVVDQFADDMGLPRPKQYSYSTLAELSTDVKNWKGKEGICVYYNNDTCIRKVKSVNYLKLHAFKSSLSKKSLAELLYEYNIPADKKEFLTIIEQEFDFECAEAAKPVVEELWIVVNRLIADLLDVQAFSIANSGLSQKEYASKLMAGFADRRHMIPFGFSMRKGNYNIKDTKKAFIGLLGE